MLLTIFIPVIAKESQRLGILLQSLSFFVNFDDIQILILTPTEDLKIIQTVVLSCLIKDNITIITDETISSLDRQKNTTGWFRQQVYKLLVCRYIKTPFYLVLDSDNFAIQKISVGDLIKDNKAMLQLQDNPDGFQNIKDVCKIIQSDCPTSRNFSVMTVTPAILSTDIVKSLVNKIESSYCNKDYSVDQYLYDQISDHKKEDGFVTEYMLYYMYAVNTGMLWNKHFPGKLVGEYNMNNVWYPQQIFEWNPKNVFSGSGFFCVYQSTCKVPAPILFDQIRDYIGDKRNNNVPKISCMMVTKDRLTQAKIAIGCFLNQTYPNKELVIVCDSQDGVKNYADSLEDFRIKTYQLPPKSKTLGELRNFSVDMSTGYLVAQWDDDDWYHPSRLSIQYDFLEKTKSDGCLLSQWLMAWPSEKKYSVSNLRDDGWEGTLLAKKENVPRYENVRKFEDTLMMKKMAMTSTLCVIKEPMYCILYIYLVHGNNTWDSDHFSVMFKDGTSISEIWEGSHSNVSKKMAELTNQKFIEPIEEPIEEPIIFWIGLLLVIIVMVFIFSYLRKRQNELRINSKSF
jgi:glycosyltransferase involved in cell wall biosynthesis